MGHIKDYEGAHLMECVLHDGIVYSDIGAMLQRQRDAVRKLMAMHSQSSIVWPTLQFAPGNAPIPICNIPGVPLTDLPQQLPPGSAPGRNTNRDPSVPPRAGRVRPGGARQFLQRALQQIKRHPSAWCLSPTATAQPAVDGPPQCLADVEERLQRYAHACLRGRVSGR